MVSDDSMLRCCNSHLLTLRCHQGGVTGNRKHKAKVFHHAKKVNSCVAISYIPCYIFPQQLNVAPPLLAAPCFYFTIGYIYAYIMLFTAQQGLGGCLYVLECCVTDTDIENPPIQWLNGHLLTMKELLEQFSERFTTTESESEEFHAIANDILLPIIEFAVQTLARSGLPPRTAKYSKRVILHCAK